MQDARSEIKAVLFDLGDTLLNFGKVETGRLFRQGCHLSYEFLRSCGQPVGTFRCYCIRNLLSIRFRYWLSNLTGKDFDSLELLRKINTKRGVKLEEEQWRHLGWLWYEPLSRVGKAEPQIRETLTKLKESGLKLGIVSNTFITGSSLEKHLEQLGILGFFTMRLFSYEFDFRKPDVRIFNDAAKKIVERPENILFVGDRLDTDIRGALRAGMHAALKAAYTNDGKKSPEGVWKIEQLSELPSLIERNNASCQTAFSTG